MEQRPFVWQGLSHVGLVRGYNEDSFGVHQAAGLAVVCDGVGGESAGDQASKIVVNTILDFVALQSRENEDGFGKGGADELWSTMTDAIKLANLRVRRLGLGLQNGST